VSVCSGQTQSDTWNSPLSRLLLRSLEKKKKKKREEEDERDQDDEEEFYIAEIKSQVEYKDGRGLWEDLCTPWVWRCGKRDKP